MNRWHNLNEQETVKDVSLVNDNCCQQYAADMLRII